MSKKEEKLRRSVLSRPPHNRKAMGVLAAASALMAADSLINSATAGRVDPSAERGCFGSGEPHPDQCSCKQCSAWRRAERYR